MLEDREVIRRCQCGQTAFMEVLIDRYKVALYSLCVRLTRNRLDADDLFQETWVRVIRRIDSFSLEGKFVTWLYAICLNRYRDASRKRRRWLARLVSSSRERDDEMERARAPGPQPEETLILGEAAQAVRRAVQELDDTYRLPILLYYFHGLSVAEISDVLGIPGGTVKSRLSTGRSRLRSMMESRHDG